MDAPVPELEARAVACAEALLDADRVLLASHIDADGLQFRDGGIHRA